MAERKILICDCCGKEIDGKYPHEWRLIDIEIGNPGETFVAAYKTHKLWVCNTCQTGFGWLVKSDYIPVMTPTFGALLWTYLKRLGRSDA